MTNVIIAASPAPELRILVRQCYESLYEEDKPVYLYEDEIDQVVADIIQTSNTDGDSRVSFEEFAKFLSE